MNNFLIFIPLALISLSQSYPVEDYVLQKVVTHEYEIDDGNGNEQSKTETIAGETSKGEYKTRLPDGKLQVVTYDSGPHGHLANVKYEDKEAADSATHAHHVTTTDATAATQQPSGAYQPQSTTSYPEGAYEDVKQIVNYEYEINDYRGNEQSRNETIDGDSAIGEYKTRMPDGQLQIVTYESGPYGHIASVKYERAGADPSTTTPATSTEHYAGAAAPVYGTGTQTPLYSTPKPYVRTSTNVRYVKVPRLSFYPYPIYAPYPYQLSHQTHRTSYRPQVMYESPSIPPYGHTFHPSTAPSSESSY